MNMQASHARDSDVDVQALGRAIVHKEATALLRLVDQIDDDFRQAVDLLLHCHGDVVVTGMGKAGLVGQKISATMASTGTPSLFLHPAEALHGDLGRIGSDDVVLVLSHSGETEEVLRILPFLRRLKVSILAITGSRESQLSRQADVTLWLGTIEEAGQWKLAPSTSTTAMLALGDALALAASQCRGFRPEDFALYHPGGSLGVRLSRVEDLMRPLPQCRVARDDQTVRRVLTSLGRPGRRCGAVLLTDRNGRLTGIFTDSDLARILENQRDHALDGPISGVMTHSPTIVLQGTMMSTALDLLVEHKISELPVVNDQGQPLGLIDITDVVSHLPHDKLTQLDHSLGCLTESDDGESPKIIPWPNRSGDTT